MRWTKMRSMVVVFLIVLNVALLVMYRIGVDHQYSASNEEIKQVLTYYEQHGIRVDCMINRKTRPQAVVLLSDESMVRREVADALLPADYHVDYMNAQAASYTTDTISMVVDNADHSINYQAAQVPWTSWPDGKVESWVKEKVQQCTGDDSDWTCIANRMEADGRSFLFVEEKDFGYLFFNYVQVFLKDDNTVDLNCRIYRTSGFDNENYEIYPIDELMYHAAAAALETGTDESTTPHVLEAIRHGYDFGGNQVVYCMEFVFDRVSVFLNCYTNEVLYTVAR